MKNIIATLTHYKALKAQEDAIKAEMDAIKADVVAYMKETNAGDKMTVGQFIVTNKEVTRTGIDEKRLRAERPDVATEYEKTTVYDRFTVK